MSRLRRILSTTRGKIGAIIVLIVVFIVGGVVLFTLFREDTEPIVEETYTYQPGDEWEETHKGLVSLKLGDTLVLDIFTEENIISYSCSYSADTRIKKADGSDIKVDDLSLGDEVEIEIGFTQLEDDAQERNCNNITLVTEDAYEEGYIQD